MIGADEDGSMTTGRKPTKPPMAKKDQPLLADRMVASDKKPWRFGSPATRLTPDAREVQQLDRLLTRIERKGKQLSTSADKLLRRVS